VGCIGHHLATVILAGYSGIPAFWRSSPLPQLVEQLLDLLGLVPDQSTHQSGGHTQVVVPQLAQLHSQSLPHEAEDGLMRRNKAGSALEVEHQFERVHLKSRYQPVCMAHHTIDFSPQSAHTQVVQDMANAKFVLGLAKGEALQHVFQQAYHWLLPCFDWLNGSALCQHGIGSCVAYPSASLRLSCASLGIGHGAQEITTKEPAPSPHIQFPQATTVIVWYGCQFLACFD